MHDFKVGDRVRITNPSLIQFGKTGVIETYCEIMCQRAWLVRIDGADDSFQYKEASLTPAPDVITINRADLPEIVVNEAGWVKADTNYLAHIDSAKSSNLRLIALHYLAAVEFLEAREKAAEEGAAAEREAAEKLNKRRDGLARELAKKAGWDAPESAVYSSHLAETQYAIDMLIAEYDRG